MIVSQNSNRKNYFWLPFDVIINIKFNIKFLNNLIKKQIRQLLHFLSIFNMF